MTETELLLTIVKDIQSHVLIINQEMGDVTVDVGVLKNQVGELMWLTRIVTAAVVGMLIEMFLRAYNNFKNNRKGVK